MPTPPFENHLFTLIEKNDADRLEKALTLQLYDPQARNEHGQSFLYRAISLHHDSCVEVLLTYGVPLIWKAQGGQTLLHEAILSHNQNLFDYTVSTLQQHLPPPQWQQLLEHAELEPHYTPLALALAEDQEHMAKFLLDNGADIFVVCPSGVNLLTLAIEKEKPQLLQLLLREGLSCITPDRNAQLPLSHALAQLTEAEHAAREPSPESVEGINILLRWGAGFGYPPELLADLPLEINGPRNNQQLLDWVKTPQVTHLQRYAIFIAIKTMRLGSNQEQDAHFFRLENFLTNQMPGSLQLRCLDQFAHALASHPQLKELILTYIKISHKRGESIEQKAIRQQALKAYCTHLPLSNQQKIFTLANDIHDFFTARQLPSYLLPYFSIISANNNSALRSYLQRLGHLQQELRRHANSRTLGRGWWGQPPAGGGATRFSQTFVWSWVLMTFLGIIAGIIFGLIKEWAVENLIIAVFLGGILTGLAALTICLTIFGLIAYIAEYEINYEDCSTTKLIPAHQQALEDLVLEGKQLLEPAIIQPLEDHWRHPARVKIRNISATLTEIHGVIRGRVITHTPPLNQNFKLLMHAFAQTQVPALHISIPSPSAASNNSLSFFSGSEYKYYNLAGSPPLQPEREETVPLLQSHSAQLQDQKREQENDFSGGLAP